MIYPPPPPFNDATSTNHASSSNDFLGTIMRVMGLSALASLFTGSNSNMFDALRLLILGSIFETGRRICYWALDRFKIREYLVSTVLSTVNLTENRLLRHSGFRRK